MTDKSSRFKGAIIQKKEETQKLFPKVKEKQQRIEEFLEYQDCKQIDRKMWVMLVKDIYIHTKKEIEIVFWFQDEYEAAVGLIEAVDRFAPNLVTKRFLGNREGMKGAKSQQKKKELNSRGKPASKVKNVLVDIYVYNVDCA